MTELNDLEWATPIDDPSRYEKPARLCKHPRWKRETRDGVTVCLSCSRELDPARLARGKSSRRLGSDQERRIERVYGPRKVGEFGDAVDHLGRDFKWQSKASRSLPPKWLAAITEPTWRDWLPRSIVEPMAHMDGLGGTRTPVVIRSYVRQGIATRDWAFVLAYSWWLLHGRLHERASADSLGYLVIPGDAFLAIHGTDQEERL